MTKRLLLSLLLLVAACPAQTVRIGVLGLFHPTALVVSGKEDPLVAEIGGRSLALERRPAHLRISGDNVELALGSSTWRGPRLLIHTRDGADTPFTVTVPGKLHRTYVGTLEVAVRSGALVPVITMDQETAVASVVAVESPPDAPPEALKALAVASRSFLAARASGHAGFDFCDTTHCQFLRQPPPDDSPAAQATRATRGLVLTWRDSVFAAMYTPACGGRTRSLSELHLPVRGYPYFSVDCPYCRQHPHQWTRDLPRPVEGEPDRLRYVRRHGWSALPGNNYEVVEKDGALIAQGSGLGHGLGLCERGAAALARDGQDFRHILAHYYPNAGIASQPISSATH